MPTGRVKFFNPDRGFGFIVPDGGASDVFVHIHDVEAAGMKTLVAGQLVAYEIGPARGAAQRPSIFACLTRSVRNVSAASSSRIPPSQPRASARSRASACGPRESRRATSTSTAHRTARRWLS